MTKRRRPNLGDAATRFRTEPRPLLPSPDGHARISVEGEILLHTPELVPPFQLERCCTQCGSSDPRKWPAKGTRTVAGGEVRVPDGHVCFWCRCYGLHGEAPQNARATRRPNPPAPAHHQPDEPLSQAASAVDHRPWWRTLYEVPRWAEIGRLRSSG